MEESPFDPSSERVFTLEDIKRLWRRKQRRWIRLSFLFACGVFGVCSLSGVGYLSKATFKEEAEQSSEAQGLSKLLSLGGTLSQSPQASVYLKSEAVLEPLVERLGLQVQIPRGGNLFTKIFRRIRENFLAEQGKPLSELDSFVFSSVCYLEEIPQNYQILFEDKTSYQLFSGKKLVAEGVLGEALSFEKVTWTLEKVPERLRFFKRYPVTISPKQRVCQEVRDALGITADKNHASIFELTYVHRDRHLAKKVLDALMVGYQAYLKKEHDAAMQEQLAYLHSRQSDIYETLEGCFTENSTYLEEHIQEKGFMGLQQELGSLLAPYQELSQKKLLLEMQKQRLSSMQKEGLDTLSIGSDPAFAAVWELARKIRELHQRRDLVEVALQDQKVLSEPLHLEALEKVRYKKAEVTQLLEVFSTKEVAALDGLDIQDAELALWMHQYKPSSKEEAVNLEGYLQNYARLLSMREKILQERLFHGEEQVEELDGMEETVTQKLQQEYNTKLDEIQVRQKSFGQWICELDKPNFQLSSLSACLEDGLSRQLIDKATALSMQLKEGKYHSSKEGERWKEELILQKGILKEHLAELLKTDAIYEDLIREKLRYLQRRQLDQIHQKLSVFKEQLQEAFVSQAVTIHQEEQLVDRKMQEIRKMAAKVPRQWQQEQWLQTKTEMAGKMLSALTEMVEGKNIGYHLHHVASKPLDMASLSRTPQKPKLFVKAGAGGIALFFGLFFSAFLVELLRGFPLSLEQLCTLRVPALGMLSRFCQGKTLQETRGEDLQTLRQAALFSKVETSKIVGLLLGKGPNYAPILAELKAKMGQKVLLVRCDVTVKTKKREKGLVEWWEEASTSCPIVSRRGYDEVPSGKFTSHMNELIQSEQFYKALLEWKESYDIVFVTVRSDLSFAESKAALNFADQVLLTITQERLEEVHPYFLWGKELSRCKAMVVG